MSLGTNRDYKTRERRALANLAMHEAKMNELIAEGHEREEASRLAYDWMCHRPRKAK